jgi:hypothetical protein
MSTITPNNFTQHLDWSIRLFKAGLRDVHVLVLGALIESLTFTGWLEEGETTAQLSRFEISQRTGLSAQQVQRALSHLVSAGYIVRAQTAKQEGEVSRTLLTAKAVESMGMRGGADLTGTAPPELVALLIGETREVIRAVIDAWNHSEYLDTRIGNEFRGGAKAWTQIEFLVQARREATRTALQEAAEAEEQNRAAEEAGEYPLALPGGETVVLDAKPYRASGATPAQRCVDMRFVRDTLVHLTLKHPALVRRDALPKLVAEIAFSRSAGFVFRHDAGSAVRILASCLARSSWSRPRKMDQHWYSLANAAVRPQGVRN